MDNPSAPRIPFPYGRGSVDVCLDPSLAQWTRIEPRSEPAVDNPDAAFDAAIQTPIGMSSDAIFHLAHSQSRVVIVTADGTRPVPNKILIPQVVRVLGVRDDQVLILLGTGTHRPNTDAEILDMFGPEIVKRFEIVNHDSFDPEGSVEVGHLKSGIPIRFNRLYVEADVRVVLGFIEPHFFAGFSGGAKGVMPGIASIETILQFHRFDMIAAENSTYAVTNGNPTFEFTREAVALCPPHLLVNVALNTDKGIAAYFVGDWREAHDRGCAHVRSHAMNPVDRAFPVVITSNTGYPLDQNLYQSVKALSAAARIVERDGTIILISECSDGLPAHGDFGQDASAPGTPAQKLAMLDSRGPAKLDQWQVQTLLSILNRCRVMIHSKLPDDVAIACGLEPIKDVAWGITHSLENVQPANRRVAVMAHGPLAVPFVGPE